MRLVKASLVQGVQAASTKEDLYPYLQAAIELEFATIPVYLSGLFTLKDAQQGGANYATAQILQSVANEEMLHMCIAANTLIALGGVPSIYPTVIPNNWPSPLPYGVDDGLAPGIAPLSKDVILDTYMRIEEPDVILQPQSGPPIPLASEPPPTSGEYQSIGDFYQAIIAKIAALPAGSIDPASASKQVTGVFYTEPQHTPLPITDARSAAEQLGIIINQGEGTSKSPMEAFSLDGNKDPAHFYRFAQIYMGNQLVVSGDGYSFSGPAVGFDPSKVYPMVPNPTLAQMQQNPEAGPVCMAFTAAFNGLVELLQQAFSGHPDAIDTAVNVMFDLPNLAQTVLETPFGDGQVAGLCFEVVVERSATPPSPHPRRARLPRR
ncbi:ferritin-like domain-containing protein [Polyangium aurulentum]|uniref:ferritin-like domain-containing protein n=1 Tax=Polyangium aurulentum TaxID=2567896 RepID=UPI0010ADCB03|nr:ferritin-like protein [Polyangium aurulentum]UQA55393.1 ferritin-like protein [Polyangium aurulentum]